MLNQPASQPGSAFCRADAEFLWNEYKYRHELIWKLIFQITTAVIAISIVPYISDMTIVKSLNNYIVALPIIGVGLTVFGWFRIRKEIDIMNRVKAKHRKFHESEYKIEYNPDGSFLRHVTFYLISLLILGILNVILIVELWLPYINSTQLIRTPPTI